MIQSCYCKITSTPILSRACRSKSSKQRKGKRFFHTIGSNGGKDIAVTAADSLHCFKKQLHKFKARNSIGWQRDCKDSQTTNGRVFWGSITVFCSAFYSTHPSLIAVGNLANSVHLVVNDILIIFDISNTPQSHMWMIIYMQQNGICLMFIIIINNSYLIINI